jgi:plasmid stability protein
MPKLSIKDVPEEIAEALRQRAARNHRSLQGELMRAGSA